MGTATRKDINNIKKRVNQLIEAESTQQETLVHIKSILNSTWYPAQVNRHSMNVIMDKVDEIVHDVNNLYSLTTSLATSLSYHQLILHIRSIWQTIGIPYLISEQFLCIPWTMLMQLQLEHFHLMSYLLWILRRGCPIWRKPYYQKCIYQFHLRIHYTSITTLVPMFCLPTNSSYSL